VHSLRSLAIGFAVAGLIASSFQLVTARPLNFRFLSHPEPTTAVAAVPMLVLAAPFVIARKRDPEPGARASGCRVHRAWRRCSSASGAWCRALPWAPLCGRSGCRWRSLTPPRGPPAAPEDPPSLQED